jgi:hypothetical protein
MKCPICQKELIPRRGGAVIGRTPGRPEFDLRAVTGYDCPTQTNFPPGAPMSHYMLRGSNQENEVATLFPYRVNTWHPPQGSHSLISKWNEKEHRFISVIFTPQIKWDTEEKMLNKLAIYVLFS